MDSGCNSNFFGRLEEDLVEQFRDKPNIKAILEVIGEQLDDLYQFFDDLRENRSICPCLR